MAALAYVSVSVAFFLALVLQPTLGQFTGNDQSDIRVPANDTPTAHIRVAWSTVINASTDAVWRYVGDFANVTWIPGVLSSKVISGSDNAPGAVRSVELADDRYSHEELLSYSIPAFAASFSYRFEYSYTVLNITPGAFPGPLLNYLGTVVTEPVYDGNLTYLFWGLELDTAWTAREALSNALSTALKATLDAVKTHFP